MRHTPALAVQLFEAVPDLSNATPVRIYWEDTDAGGVVYHANYLKFFERARTEWLRVAGAQQQALLVQTGGTFVVADVQVRYLVPAKLDDLIMVTAKLVEQGQVFLQIEQQAWRGDTLLAQGRVRIAWVHTNTLRPTRIPPLMLDALTRCK